MDTLVKIIQQQMEFSYAAFGPGRRTEMLVDHIRKELTEVLDDPTDLGEWVDLIILALDGAWRAGYNGYEIIDGILKKQEINRNRKWPDWKTAPAGKAIEHVRTPSRQLSEEEYREHIAMGWTDQFLVDHGLGRPPQPDCEAQYSFKTGMFSCITCGVSWSPDRVPQDLPCYAVMADDMRAGKKLDRMARVNIHHDINGRLATVHVDPELPHPDCEAKWNVFTGEYQCDRCQVTWNLKPRNQHRIKCHAAEDHNA